MIDRSVICTCGETLLEAIDPPAVTVDGERFPFRRTTDYIVCRACGATYQAAELEVGPGYHLVATELAAIARDPDPNSTQDP
jgi:hypothetical protein